jgi:hypothetical protein
MHTQSSAETRRIKLDQLVESEGYDTLEARFAHGNWSLGNAFYLGNLCFIQQVDGGDEWLGIKENVAFESASCAAMIAAGTFRDFLSDVQGATLEQCASLAVSIQHVGADFLFHRIESDWLISRPSAERLFRSRMASPSGRVAGRQLRGRRAGLRPRREAANVGGASGSVFGLQKKSPRRAPISKAV